MTTIHHPGADADGASDRSERTGRAADRDVHFEVEQLYYEEAELLDDGRYVD